MSFDSKDSNSPKTQKKILENPFVGSLVVPIAIVLVGALIIFGVTKMLSADRSYKDLVNEIQSKTFGNKWVAAYELSKVINSSQIPEEEYPWLVQNLTIAYKDSIDARSRAFIIAALGALRNELTVETLSIAQIDQDLDVRFHAVVGLGNMPKDALVNWTQTIKMLEAPETVIRQTAVLALATHKVSEAEAEIVKVLNDQSAVVRYAAATALIAYKNTVAKDTLGEILKLKGPADGAIVAPPALDAVQIRDLKLSVMDTLAKNNWSELNNILLELAKGEENISVATKAKEVLNLLKK